jgi:hypothetical protein
LVYREVRAIGRVVAGALFAARLAVDTDIPQALPGAACRRGVRPSTHSSESQQTIVKDGFAFNGDAISPVDVGRLQGHQFGLDV